ncbi:MAG: site-specific integrase [Actinomycetaceae bacterium]|nr:site-specific integrase [Actinomycetaceae bacterium]
MQTYPTLSQYWTENKDLATASIKQRTASVYTYNVERRVLPVLGHMPISEIKKSNVRRLIKELESQGLSHSSISDHLSPLSRLLEVAVDDEIISVNPARNLRRRKPVKARPTSRALTTEELADFLSRVPAGHYRRICAALAFTGMRLGEVSALTPADIDLEKGIITVSRSVSPDIHGKLVEGTTKTGKTRAVPIIPAFRPYLLEAMDGVGDDERIFVGPRGGTLDSSNLARAINLRAWREEVKKFPKGEPKLHIHDLRHTVLTHLFYAGVPANVVQSVAGHSSLDVTMLYTQADIGAAKQAGDLFGVYLQKSIPDNLGENYGK